MNSHFSVILLCFSSVYCMSSTIENLDLNGLKRILDGETTIKEWETAIDQDIYYGEDAHGNKNTVNVKHALDNFVQHVNNGDETEFETIRNIITRAYQCTLTKYVSLSAFLILEDFWDIRTNITLALNYMARHSINYDVLQILGIKFLELFYNYSGKKYHLDFDFKFQGNIFQLHANHDYVSNLSKYWHNVLGAIIEKNLGFKIKYKIYPDVSRKRFTNYYDQPFVAAINELLCVLNETIKILDSFTVDKCVQHGGSFLKNFKSLKTGINEDVVLLTSHLDGMVAKGINSALYRDWSIPGPGASQENNEIKYSGCFVGNVELEISGLKMDLANPIDPTEIYGPNFDERIREPVVLKLVESINEDAHPSDVKLGMLLVRDNESSLGDYPSRRDSLIETIINEEGFVGHVRYRGPTQ